MMLRARVSSCRVAYNSKKQSEREREIVEERISFETPQHFLIVVVVPSSAWLERILNALQRKLHIFLDRLDWLEQAAVAMRLNVHQHCLHDDFSMKIFTVWTFFSQLSIFMLTKSRKNFCRTKSKHHFGCEKLTWLNLLAIFSANAQQQWANDEFGREMETKTRDGKEKHEKKRNFRRHFTDTRRNHTEFGWNFSTSWNFSDAHTEGHQEQERVWFLPTLLAFFPPYWIIVHTQTW